MEENKKSTEKTQEISYDQLKMLVNQLSNEKRMLIQKLREFDFTAVRLDYLFKVLKYKESFPAKFVRDCISEVQELMTITEEEETKDSKEE